MERTRHSPTCDNKERSESVKTKKIKTNFKQTMENHKENDEKNCKKILRDSSRSFTVMLWDKVENTKDIMWRKIYHIKSFT